MKPPAILAAAILFSVACGSGSSGSNEASGGASSVSTSTSFAASTSSTSSISSGSGGSAGAASSTSTGSNVMVSPCDGLAAIGTFEEITPPELKAAIDAAKGTSNSQVGTFALAADPVNLGTLYAGTFMQKVWKSTDCGATWTGVSTGQNGDKVNSGMNWTLAVDPVDPETVYTNSGYGSNGLFKSKNGGTDWDPVWPPPSQPDLAKAFTYNFANVVAIDPTDHLHILLTFHEQCLAPHPATCIAESKDAGGTWQLIDGDPSWDGNEGQVIFFLGDGTTWLWGSQTNGFWRGSGSGASWEAVKGMTTSHLQGSELVQTPSGAFLVSGADGVWRSEDGKASSWQLIPNTGPILGGVVGDGKAMYTNNCYFPGFCPTAKYFKSADEGKTWAVMPGPNVDMGGTLAFDPGHGLLFSSNGHAGLWRVRVR